MSEQTKPVSKWKRAECGKLWANKDDQGKVKNFSGTLTIDGKEIRVFVGKRQKFENDDPNKNYPSLIIYNSALLDADKESTDVKKPVSKTSSNKTVTTPAQEHTELV